MNWENDTSFMRAARLLWPEDVRLATIYAQTKGKAEARRVMLNRYGGVATASFGRGSRPGVPGRGRPASTGPTY